MLPISSACVLVCSIQLCATIFPGVDVLARSPPGHTVECSKDLQKHSAVRKMLNRSGFFGRVGSRKIIFSIPMKIFIFIFISAQSEHAPLPVFLSVSPSTAHLTTILQSLLIHSCFYSSVTNHPWHSAPLMNNTQISSLGTLSHPFSRSTNTVKLWPSLWFLVSV